jgi:large subunit ribosomal protein L13e
MKHNNQLPNAHFRKHWQMRVKCWFDQPGRKKTRRVARLNKAIENGIRPAGYLRPAVHCPTIQHNSKIRAGRGFTLEELKAAGLSKRYARTIGISVDPRRKNHSLESLQLNTQRLKTYLSKLVIKPLNPAKPLKGEATQQEWDALVNSYQQNKATVAKSTSEALPTTQPTEHEAPRKVTQAEKDFNAFKTLRKAKTMARFQGRYEVKMKKAAEAEEEEAKKKK